MPAVRPVRTLTQAVTTGHHRSSKL